MGEIVQMSMMDSFETQNTLEVAKMHFVERSFTNAEQLFSGFDHLYVITFSYSISFINNIIKHFKTADIVIGCNALAKYDIMEAMAFQKETLKIIKRHEALIQRIIDGEVRIWLADSIIAHEKVFLMTNTPATKTRVVFGSANFSNRGFSGNQRENICYCDNDRDAFDYYMEEFNLVRDLSTQEIICDSSYVKRSQNEQADVDLKELPIIKKAIAKEAGIIVDSLGEDPEKVKYITEASQIRNDLKQIMPKFQKHGTQTLITPQKVHELIRASRNAEAEKQAKQREYPRFTVDFANGTATMNGKPVDMEHTQDQVRNDLNCLMDYFAGFDSFYGDVVQAKREYFKMLNFLFLSPFVAKLRHIAYLTDFSYEFFPYFAVLHGKKSAGKSELIDTAQIMMYGRSLGRIKPDIFTKLRIQSFLQNAVGVPIHINDIGKDRFDNNSGEVIKCDEEILRDGAQEYPMFVMTTNEIPSLRPQLMKRVYYSSVSITQENTKAASKKKHMCENRKRMTTAFYHEYLSKIIPAVNMMIEQMEQYKMPQDETKIWNPDIFAVSSQIINDIFHECDLDVPDYAEPVEYTDYFGHTVSQDNIRGMIRQAWIHNRKAFKIFAKQNRLEYNAGERTYEAIRVCDMLPEFLDPKPIGTKVIMKLNEAITFFGIRFKNHILR